MATANELMDELHRIREEDLDRSSGLSVEEYLARLEARVAPLRARLNLTQGAAGAPSDGSSVDAEDSSSRR